MSLDLDSSISIQCEANLKELWESCEEIKVQ